MCTIWHHSSSSSAKILSFLILLPLFCFIQPHRCSPIDQQQIERPNEEETIVRSSTEKPALQMKALKMRGPDPLGPGQRGTVKTDYFDPKTYSTKDLRDFHRLTQGLNADIRRMVEETERIRQKSAADAEELERLRNWALQDQRQWWLLMLTGSAMAVALLALALANLLLAKAALLKGGGGGNGSSGKKAALLEESGA